ncbi:MAG: hypothetical protein QXI07_09955 [Pyrobaculum sp.]
MKYLIRGKGYEMIIEKNRKYFVAKMICVKVTLNAMACVQYDKGWKPIPRKLFDEVKTSGKVKVLEMASNVPICPFLPFLALSASEIVDKVGNA